jgi:hypothetical protein
VDAALVPEESLTDFVAPEISQSTNRWIGLSVRASYAERVTLGPSRSQD